MKDVIEESRSGPVLVDFWAPWCGPCKTLTPILEKAVRAAKGKVKLVKMNIDEHPQISAPARHPVDPGRLRLRERPAGRRLHGRAAREPGECLHRTPARQGRRRRRRDRRAEARGGSARRRRCRRAPPSFSLRCSRRSRKMCLRWAASPARTSMPAIRPLLARRWGSSPKARRTIRPWPRRAPRSTCRAGGLGRRLSELERRSQRTRSTIRRASISPWRSTPSGEREAALDHLLEIVRRNRTWNDDGGAQATRAVLRGLGAHR